MRPARISTLALQVFLLLLGGYFSALSAAEPAAYKVEMLIFTDEYGRMTAGGEPAQPLSNPQAAVDLTQPGAGDYFHALPDNELALATARSILENSGRYEVITDVAWRQPARSTQTVRIHGGIDYTLSATPAQTDFGNPNLLNDSPTPFKLPQLDGTVTVTRGRYLEVITDLVLREPAAIRTLAANQRPGPVNALYQFRIKHERLMQSQAIYYLDHPLLGVLTQITPIEAQPKTKTSNPVTPVSKPATPNAQP